MLQSVTFFSLILALATPTTALGAPAPLPRTKPGILHPRRKPFVASGSPQQNCAEANLLAACVSGKEMSVSNLLLQAVNPNCADENGDSPLIRAAMCNHPFIVQQLLAAKAIPTQLNKNGFSALDLAIQEGHSDAVEFLITAFKNSGTDLNQLNAHGFPVLAIAAQYGHDKIVELLIHKGALVNMPNKHGQTAIALAIANGHVSTVALLLANGATLPNFQISVKKKAQEMAKLLSLRA